MGDIKIAQFLFKEGKLDTAPMSIVNVNMPSSLTIDQYRLLINTSMVVRKSLQVMENKIESLRKKIDQYKKECSFKDNIIIELHNQNKDLLGKMEKQKFKFAKSLAESKTELDNGNK